MGGGHSFGAPGNSGGAPAMGGGHSFGAPGNSGGAPAMGGGHQYGNSSTTAPGGRRPSPAPVQSSPFSPKKKK
jgi:hypothetical protein